MRTIWMIHKDTMVIVPNDSIWIRNIEDPLDNEGIAFVSFTQWIFYIAIARKVQTFRFFVQ